MKKIALLIIMLAALVCCSSAYIISFEVPAEVNLGDTIVIEGTSTINPGVTMTIVLYSQKVSIQELERKSFVIQSDGSWRVNFETDKLSKGRYKFEIPETSDVGLGPSSTKTAFFEIIDRSDQIFVSSPPTQDYNGYLSVAGRSTTRGNMGVQIKVESKNDEIMPTTWISTDTGGHFSKDVAIPGPGTYYVYFYDNKGFITMQEFYSKSAGSTVTPTSSSEQTISTEPGKSLSAQSFASCTSPAYFSVLTNSGILNVETSEGHNWILEYYDENGAVRLINQYSDNRAEKFSIPVTGGIIYLKVYPSDASDSGYVTITADGASYITVNADAASIFDSKSTPVPTQSGVIFPIGALSCFVALIFLSQNRRRQ